MQEILKPIFIIGSGRSGTTITFRTLAKHKELGYFSNYDVLFPRLFKYGILPFLEKNNSVKELIGKIKPIVPAQETIGIMNYCKIRKKKIPLSPRDVNLSESECFKKMIVTCLSYNKVNRYIGKNTLDGMRIRFLNKIFPDSVFIHVLRDGRANVNSYLNVPFFHKIGFWWWDNKTLKDWVAEGRDIIELAVLHWKNNVTEIIKQSRCLSEDRYFEIKYEELTTNPKIYFKELIDFCDLKWDNHFKSVIETTKFENRNYKWEKNLNSDQKEKIESILHEFLQKLDYI